MPALLATPCQDVTETQKTMHWPASPLKKANQAPAKTLLEGLMQVLGKRK